MRKIKAFLLLLSGFFCMGCFADVAGLGAQLESKRREFFATTPSTDSLLMAPLFKKFDEMKAHGNATSVSLMTALTPHATVLSLLFMPTYTQELLRLMRSLVTIAQGVDPLLLENSKLSSEQLAILLPWLSVADDINYTVNERVSRSDFSLELREIAALERALVVREEFEKQYNAIKHMAQEDPSAVIPEKAIEKLTALLEALSFEELIDFGLDEFFVIAKKGGTVDLYAQAVGYSESSAWVKKQHKNSEKLKKFRKAFSYQTLVSDEPIDEVRVFARELSSWIKDFEGHKKRSQEFQQEADPAVQETLRGLLQALSAHDLFVYQFSRLFTAAYRAVTHKELVHEIGAALQQLLVKSRVLNDFFTVLYALVKGSLFKSFKEGWPSIIDGAVSDKERELFRFIVDSVEQHMPLEAQQRNNLLEKTNALIARLYDVFGKNALDGLALKLELLKKLREEYEQKKIIVR